MPMSTSAVARASASARWQGGVWAPKNSARVGSLQLGTSAAPSTSRASATVSSTGKSGQGTPQAPQAALRKPTSNGALCAVSTQPRANARNLGSAAAIGGAWPAIASVIPVSAVMSAGIAPPGLTSVQNSELIRSPATRTAPISVMLAWSGSQPVVSTSTITNSRSVSGWLSPASGWLSPPGPAGRGGLPGTSAGWAAGPSTFSAVTRSP